MKWRDYNKENGVWTASCASVMLVGQLIVMNVGLTADGRWRVGAEDFGIDCMISPNTRYHGSKEQAQKAAVDFLRTAIDVLQTCLDQSRSQIDQ